MDIGALISIALGRDAALPGAALKAGDCLPVRVLAVREDGKVLVDCGRFRAVAEVTFPVSAGEEFSVRVVDTQATLRLEVVRPSAPSSAGGIPVEAPPAESARALPAGLLREVGMHASRLLASLPQAPSAGGAAGLTAALVRVSELLQPLEPGKGADVPGRLGDLCRNSGVFLETRLQNELVRDAAEAAAGHPAHMAGVRRVLAADLKAQLAALVHELQAGTGTLPAREASELLRSAGALLGEIVQQQAEIARHADDARQMTLIHFSLPLTTREGAARLKVGFPRRRHRGRSGGHRAALLVELDRLGPVRADLQLTEKCLTADLFVSRAALKAAVEDELAGLQAVLGPLFECVRVSVRASAKKVADFEWEDLRPARAGRLDVRA
ncbi:MAG: hypothetical protein MUE48_01640 [Desulfobacterales bacterium]|nr:hypothetical protein [Desulfobacterales bacterium]